MRSRSHHRGGGSTYKVDYATPGVENCQQTSVPGPTVSSSFVLAPAQPNPFRRGTRIAYALDRTQAVSVAVFDMNGRRVRSLVDAPQGPGEYTLRWDGRADDGSRLTAGVYFMRVTAGNEARPTPAGKESI